jgi:hypothetical protein
MTACERQLVIDLARHEVARCAAAQGTDPGVDRRLRYLIGIVRDSYDAAGDPWAVVPIL